jgi:hypothetical protein
VQEQEVQKALFAVLAEALPAIIAAVSARQKEVVIEEAPAFDAGGSDQDGEAEADRRSSTCLPPPSARPSGDGRADSS